MPTNKIVLRSVEEFMAGYTPTYQPIYPLFMSNAREYATEAGEAISRTVRTIGDIRGHRLTPKDTEIKQIAVAEAKKNYKKYFFANQFLLSTFQDREGVEDVTAQVLDEHHLQQDELFLFGDGSSPETVLNNGLYYSTDPFYSLKSSVEISATGTLYDFHSKVMATAQEADQLAGRKIIFFYGAAIIPLFNSLYDTAAKSWRAALAEALGPDYSIAKLPERATPNGANGWLVANMDRCKLHHSALPQVMSQGLNEEKMYVWTNFLLASMMLEVTSEGGVIRQPATIAAS